MKNSKILILFILLTGASLILTGCGLGDAQAGRIPSPDWSRGVGVSTDVGGTAGMLVHEAAQSVHLAWPTAADDQAHIHYKQLNDAAEIVADLDLDLPEGRQRTPRLLAAKGNNVHLFWGLRLPDNLGWELWHALLDETGATIGQPDQVSPEEMKVGDYTIAQNSSGDAVVIWEQDPAKGFWAARVTADGVDSELARLTEFGDSPSAYLEEDGTLHLSWLDGAAIKYAAFPQGELTLTEGQIATSLQEIIANLDGPVVGVGGDWVYILWSVFARSGLESGTGWTEYIAFPKGEPAAASPSRVWMLTDEEQPYNPYDGAYALTQLAPSVTSPALTADYILEPDAATGRDDELAVAVASKQIFRLDEVVQMAVMLFKDGEFDGYQMAAKTEGFSLDGNLQSDSNGNLYLAWREGTGRQLYFAATEPELRSELNQLGRADFFQVVVGGGLEAFVGALFFPLSLIWFIPGALLLGVWKLRKDNETVDDATSRILLVVAVLLYQGTKILFLPSVVAYVPFSAWLDVPPGLTTMLQIMVPLLSFGLGILIAEWVRRRKPGMSSLLYFFIACGVDALITLMIYGVNFLGVI